MRMVYICDNCGQTWENIAQAISCEQSHVEAKSIRYKYDKGNRYPKELICNFEGLCIKYTTHSEFDE